MKASRAAVFEKIKEQPVEGFTQHPHQFKEDNPFFEDQHEPFLKRRLSREFSKEDTGDDAAVWTDDPDDIRLLWAVTKEIFDYELGPDWLTACEGDDQRMGTIGDDALLHLISVVRKKEGRQVRDIGAGYGFVLFCLRAVGIDARGCEICKPYCDKANEVGTSSQL